MKKFFGIAAFLTICSLAGNAQSDYKSAIGARLGTTYYDVLSFSYKSFITDPGAIELNVGFGAKKYGKYNSGSVSASAAYQHHFDIAPVDGLKWFVGGGLLIYNSFSDFDDRKGFGFGLFPTGGVDYKFGNIPLNVSADVRPTFHVVSPGVYNAFYPSVGLAARYTLGR